MMKVSSTTMSDTANTGPTKLWMVFRSQVIQPYRALPMMGSRKNLPKAITIPEIARITKAVALTQCAARSKQVNRSMRRPVGASCILIEPLPRKNSKMATRMMSSKPPP
ncbi:hypothetical protein D9M68_750820 [compost metagenome]